MSIILEPEAPEGLTLEELMEEVFQSGFDDLKGKVAGERRVLRWINIAYREITGFKPWPFLEAEYEGALPATIANLAHVLDVYETHNKRPLRVADRRELIREETNLALTGPSTRWYMERGEDIAAYPVSVGATYNVRFIVVPGDLTEPEDKPLIPAAFQYLIVDGAIMRAYRNRDNYEAAKLVKENWEFGIEQMVKALMKTN